MPDSHVTVSIGMPVYNGARWVRDAAESILRQTRGDLELIISDNASTDDSAAICRKLSAADSRVRFFRQETNVGATANYNAVLEHATGPYFKWASCNDYCDPRFLELCLGVLESDPSVVLAYPRTGLFEHDPADAEPYDDNLNLLSDDPYVRFRDFLEQVGLNNVMNGVIRRDSLVRTVVMRPYFSSDTWLMAELALHGKFREVPERLFFRRMSGHAATKMKSSSEVVRHWNPDMRPVHFPVTRGILQLFGALYRAPLRRGTRLRTVRLMIRRAIWSRHEFWRELIDSGRYYLGLNRQENNNA